MGLGEETKMVDDYAAVSQENSGAGHRQVPTLLTPSSSGSNLAIPPYQQDIGMHEADEHPAARIKSSFLRAPPGIPVPGAIQGYSTHNLPHNSGRISQYPTASAHLSNRWRSTTTENDANGQARPYSPTMRYALGPQTNEMSPNYRGNPFLAGNYSADIPEAENCSMWITNLPPHCTYGMLLGGIRNCDKVFAVHINPPVYNTTHSTAAAKVVFFSRRGVERLLCQSAAGQFTVGLYTPKVRLNRIRSAPRAPSQQCRVLHIEGSTDIVNRDYLNMVFSQNFQYHLEEDPQVLFRDSSGRQRLEWKFASFRAQAQTAQAVLTNCKRDDAQILDEDLRQKWRDVTFGYGVDPCM